MAKTLLEVATDYKSKRSKHLAAQKKLFKLCMENSEELRSQFNRRPCKLVDITINNKKKVPVAEVMFNSEYAGIKGKIVNVPLQ